VSHQPTNESVQVRHRLTSNNSAQASITMQYASPVQNGVSSRASIDVMDLLERVHVPTLILHSRDDDVIPIAEGHILAAGIPGAQFVELDSKNHILLESEPAWERFCAEVLDFMEVKDQVTGEDPAFEQLTAREREVLALITEGLGNAAIAERLSISEKTVRNHVSNVFDKLGVWTRAQAMVFAHDRGFRSANG